MCYPWQYVMGKHQHQLVYLSRFFKRVYVLQSLYRVRLFLLLSTRPTKKTNTIAICIALFTKYVCVSYHYDIFREHHICMRCASQEQLLYNIFWDLSAMRFNGKLHTHRRMQYF